MSLIALVSWYVVVYALSGVGDVWNGGGCGLLQLCKIVEGQRYTKSLSSKQRQAQIAACKQGPQERQNTCEGAMNVTQYSSTPLVAEFGLKFENRLASLDGRVLPAPQVLANTPFMI